MKFNEAVKKYLMMEGKTVTTEIEYPYSEMDAKMTTADKNIKFKKLYGTWEDSEDIPILEISGDPVQLIAFIRTVEDPTEKTLKKEYPELAKYIKDYKKAYDIEYF